MGALTKRGIMEKKKKRYSKDPHRTKTLGQIYTENIQKEQEDHSIDELGYTMTKDFMDRIRSEIERGKKLYTGDFFIVMLTKAETIFTKTVGAYFTCSAGCPSPHYDQTVYHYSRPDDELNLVWTIPSEEWCSHLKHNALYFDREFHEIIGYVLDFYDGKLFQKCCILNEQKAMQLHKVA